MRHLLQIGCKAFKNSAATINFNEKINKLFDVMNTKRVNDHAVFKSALNQSNASIIFPFLDEVEAYLKTLRIGKTKCTAHGRKTGFLGFIINIHSIKQMYEEYVRPGSLKNLAIFWHSQDPLETFFGRIRSACGSNNNATVQQAQSAIRKLLYFNEIKSSESANCADSLNILTCSSVTRTEENEADSEIIDNIYDSSGYEEVELDIDGGDNEKDKVANEVSFELIREL